MAENVFLYFGNELMPDDMLAIKVGKILEKSVKGFEFRHCLSPEELLNFSGCRRVVILDVCPQVLNPARLDSLKRLKKREMSTMHDMDLNFFLKMAEDLSEWSPEIIAIPIKGNPESLARDVKNLLR